MTVIRSIVERVKLGAIIFITTIGSIAILVLPESVLNRYKLNSFVSEFSVHLFIAALVGCLYYLFCLIDYLTGKFKVFNYRRSIKKYLLYRIPKDEKDVLLNFYDSYNHRFAFTSMLQVTYGPVASLIQKGIILVPSSSSHDFDFFSLTLSLLTLDYLNEMIDKKTIIIEVIEDKRYRYYWPAK